MSGKEDVREDGGEDSRSEKLSDKCRGANIEVLEEGSQTVVVWNVLKLELSYCLQVRLNTLKPRIKVSRINE